MPKKSYLFKLEKLAKNNLTRVILISISVSIGAIYTNSEKKEYVLKSLSLEKKIDTLIVKNKVLTDRVNDLQKNMLVLSLVDDNYPNPKWMKSANLMMLKLNKAYERQFLDPIGKTREDYIGNFDYDIYSRDIAYAFRKNDMKVIKLKRPVTFKEKITNKEGKITIMKFTKYPIIVDGVVIAIGGFANIEHGE